jgi:hypothetical protein
LTQTPVRNPLLTTFSSMAAVRHGDYVAKIRLAPASENTTRTIHCELDLRVRPEVFWLMNCRPALSISTSRSSCARISRQCQSTTLRSNGRKSSLPS